MTAIPFTKMHGLGNDFVVLDARRDPLRIGALAARPSTYFHNFAYHTIAFPVSSAGGDAPAMGTHRQAFPTPRGSGKRDPKGGLARPPGGQGGCPPGVVARRV